MTSANPGGEPLVIADEEAFARLAGIAEGFLTHDRAIVARCDDSVLLVRPTGTTFVRRARGYVPRRIAYHCRPLVAGLRRLAEKIPFA